MSKRCCSVVQFVLCLQDHKLFDRSDNPRILGQVVITSKDHLQEVGHVAQRGVRCDQLLPSVDSVYCSRESWHLPKHLVDVEIAGLLCGVAGWLSLVGEGVFVLVLREVCH